MMRFLVLGATGMAGHVISLYLQEKGYEVLGWSRRQACFLENHIEGDASDLDSIREAIALFRPDVIVNCVGLLNDECDRQPALAVYLNSCFPHCLEQMVNNTGARVFHISTDCVFAGGNGPYSEHSFPDGTSFYDRTKALGELVSPAGLTLRQSIVGPDTDPQGIGLLNWFMMQRGEVAGWTSAIWTGLTTLELARAVEACALDGASGLVNMVPPGRGLTKYELLVLFRDHIRSDEIIIHPISGNGTDKTLIRTALLDGYHPNSYEKQVEELGVWIRDHGDLYPHYHFALRREIS